MSLSLKEIHIPESYRPSHVRISSMSEYRNRLYLGTCNHTDGASLLCLDASDRLTHVLQPDRDNIDIFGLVEFRNDLYFGTYNLQGGELFSLRDGAALERVFTRGFDDPGNKDIWSFATLDDALYIGTFNDRNGARLYRTEDSNSYRCIFETKEPSEDYIRDMLVWKGRIHACLGLRCKSLYLLLIDSDGKIDLLPTPIPAPHSDIYVMCLFQNRLFLGVSANPIEHRRGGCEVWTYDGLRFDRCSPPGFGNPNNEYIHAMTTFRNLLVCSVQNHMQGCELWATADGGTWDRIAGGGFGAGPANETVVRSLRSFSNRLYCGTSNQGHGFHLYSLS